MEKIEKTDFIKIDRSEIKPLEMVCRFSEGQPVPLQFSKNGLECKALNPSSSAIVEAVIKPRNYLNYNLKSDFTIGLDLELLYKVLKRLQNYELEFGVSNNRFVIKDSTSVFALPIYELEKNPSPNIETISFPYQFKIDKDEFYKILSSAGIIGNELTMVCNGQLTFSCENQQGSFKKVLKIKSDSKKEKEIKSAFSIELLRRVFERGSYGEVSVSVGEKAIKIEEDGLKVVIASCVGENYNGESFDEEENEE
jgi:hypothetical protein